MVEPAPDGRAEFSPPPGDDKLEDILSPLLIVCLALGCLGLDQLLAFALWGAGRPALALSVAALAGIVLPLTAVHWVLGLPLRRSLQLHALRWREVGAVVWILAAAVPVTYAASALSTRFFPPGQAQFDLYDALIPTGPVSLVGGALAVVVCVPLAEEMLFRRLVQGALARRLSGPAAAIVAGILFAISHGAMWMLLPIACLGTVLGLMVLWTGKLTTSWIGHGLFNLVAYVELCVSHDARGERLERWAEPWVVWLPCLVALVAGLWFLRRSSGGIVRAAAAVAHGDQEPST